MERKPYLLMFIMILCFHAFVTVHGMPITIEALQGSWTNSNNNRMKVEGTSVKRNGVFWGELNETVDNIIINGWVLDKMSGNFEWTLHGARVTWTRVGQPIVVQLTDHKLLENRIAATGDDQRFTLTETECGNNVDIISLVDFEAGENILAIPYQNNANQYHCFSQESLMRWIVAKNQRCIHPLSRAHVDVNTIVIGKFQIKGNRLIKAAEEEKAKKVEEKVEEKKKNESWMSKCLVI